MRTRFFYWLAAAGIASSLAFSIGPRPGRSLTIRLLRTHLISNVHVGHQWSNFLSVNQQIIHTGESITINLKPRAPLTITAYAIEDDKKHPDTGKTEKIFTYSDLIAIDKARFEIQVTVKEVGGQYEGNLAKWMYVVEVKK